MKLDKTDYDILRDLQQEGKISNLELSRKVGLTPAPTLGRVRKMERSGIIKGYYADLNEAILGLNIKAFIHVSLVRQRQNAIENFAKKIKQIDEITECYQITGTYDYQLKVVVKDVEALNDLISQKLSKLEEIRKIQSYIILSVVKQTRVLPLKYKEEI